MSSVKEFVLILRDKCGMSQTVGETWKRMQIDHPELDYVTEIEYYREDAENEINAMQNRTTTNGFPSLCYLEYTTNKSPWEEKYRSIGQENVVKLLAGDVLEQKITSFRTASRRVIKITLCFSNSCEHLSQYLPLWDEKTSSIRKEIDSCEFHFCKVDKNGTDGSKLAKRNEVAGVMPVVIISTRPYIFELNEHEVKIKGLPKYKNRLLPSTAEDLKNIIYEIGTKVSKT